MHLCVYVDVYMRDMQVVARRETMWATGVEFSFGGKVLIS